MTASSRLGESLRAARARAGWTREALAYHSGVSWSAIAQIESGRRTEVRAGTLTALATSLNVSVDHLLGRAPTGTTALLEHRVLPYGSDEEFLAGTVPLVTGGIEQEYPVLVVADRTKIGHLRDAITDGIDHVDFFESKGWLTSPSEALDRFRTFVGRKLEAGAPWINIVGEPIWAGRSDEEITAWTRFESIFNLVFASAPATAICPYDTRSLPEAIVADAHRTHPVVTHGTDAIESSTYSAPEDLILEP